MSIVRSGPRSSSRFTSTKRPELKFRVLLTEGKPSAVRIAESLEQADLPTISSIPYQRFGRFCEIAAEVPNVAVMPLMSWGMFLVPQSLQGAPRGNV
jgi:hypothetical protein